ncbi:hypothetical protein STXM2123_704 [Streptomyces sp. F-3]|nr:hypothetical protein STXM2123_704 [Streptomyces sp. F-3]
MRPGFDVVTCAASLNAAGGLPHGAEPVRRRSYAPVAPLCQQHMTGAVTAHEGRRSRRSCAREPLDGRLVVLFK